MVYLGVQLRMAYERDNEKVLSHEEDLYLPLFFVDVSFNPSHRVKSIPQVFQKDVPQ